MATIITKEIDGNQVTIQLRSPRSGIRLKALLLSILGMSFIRMIFSFANERKGGDKDVTKMTTEEKKELGQSIMKDPDFMDKMVPLIGDVLEKLTPDKADTLVAECIQGVFVNGADISQDSIFDTVFLGKDSLMFKVIGLSIWENVKGFFSFLNTSDTPGAGEKTSTEKE